VCPFVGPSIEPFLLCLFVPWCGGQYPPDSLQQRRCLVLQFFYIGMDVGAFSAQYVTGTMPAMCFQKICGPRKNILTYFIKDTYSYSLIRWVNHCGWPASATDIVGASAYPLFDSRQPFLQPVCQGCDISVCGCCMGLLVGTMAPAVPLLCQFKQKVASLSIAGGVALSLPGGVFFCKNMATFPTRNPI
jgi:hypothetical protein